MKRVVLRVALIPFLLFEMVIIPEVVDLSTILLAVGWLRGPFSTLPFRIFRLAVLPGFLGVEEGLLVFSDTVGIARFGAVGHSMTTISAVEARIFIRSDVEACHIYLVELTGPAFLRSQLVLIDRIRELKQSVRITVSLVTVSDSSFKTRDSLLMEKLVESLVACCLEQVD